jgi:glycosyltransferase involved in cell wall biosynthesis
VRQVPLASFANLALRRFPHRQRQLNGWTEPDGRMIERVRRDDFASADALYTVLINSDLDLVREAQARGIRTVHEVMIGPDVGHWVRAEQALFPGIEESVLPEQIRAGSERDARKYELSDLILVPSEFVRRSVLGLGADPERIATVPYGLDESWLDQISEPVPGRVLFVGSVGLRKGSHHLAAACRLLERRRVACEVRVVTTPNCGSAVRDGVDGFIVPIRDAEAIADKVELLLSDRELRARMGRSARERARKFTWERYGERLLGALARLA